MLQLTQFWPPWYDPALCLLPLSNHNGIDAAFAICDILVEFNLRRISQDIHDMELSPSNSSKRFQIPAEILTLIFSFLVRIDVKAARHVCRPFNTHASPYLLDTAIAGSQTETIERFEAIAAHELFSIHVKTVIFSVCSLEREYATVSDYYNELHTRYEDSEKQLPTLEQCEQHWNDYQKAYKDQAELQERGDDERRIQNALRLMPNVNHLVLSSNAWKMGIHPLNKLWHPSNYKIIVPRRDPVKGPWQFSHGFTIMSSALLYNGIRLSSLSHTKIRSISDALRPSCFSKKTLEIFRHLHKVALSLNDKIYRDLSWQTKVGECLSIAEGLESLEIVSEISGDQIDFSRIFRVAWPKLYYLKLRINLDYKSFTIFCQSHGGSLRSLHLQSLCLFGGTWERLVEVIREHLKPTNVWLEDLADEDSEDIWGRRDDLSEGRYRLSEAEEYLLHGGDNPFESGMLQRIPNPLLEP